MSGHKNYSQIPCVTFNRFFRIFFLNLKIDENILIYNYFFNKGFEIITKNLIQVSFLGMSISLSTPQRLF